MHPSGYVLEEVREGQVVEESKCRLIFLLQSDFKTEIDSTVFIKECSLVVAGIKKFFKERGKFPNPNLKKPTRGRAGSFGRLKNQLLSYSPNKIRRPTTPERSGQSGGGQSAYPPRALLFEGEEDGKNGRKADNKKRNKRERKKKVSKSWEKFALADMPVHRGTRAMSVSDDDRPAMGESLPSNSPLVASSTVSARGSRTPTPVRTRSFTNYGEEKKSARGGSNMSAEDYGSTSFTSKEAKSSSSSYSAESTLLPASTNGRVHQNY